MEASRAAADAPLIDCHAHIFQADFPLTETAWTRPAYDFPVERYLALLDAHDIPFGVIAGISLYGEYNDYMCACLRTHRRLRGTAIVSPSIDFYTLRALRDDGVVGIRLMLGRDRPLPDLMRHDWQVLFRRLRDLGMHVHVAAPAARIVPLLPPLVAQGNDLVIDHFADILPGDLEPGSAFHAILRAAQSGGIWIKVSAVFRLASPQLGVDAAALLLRKVGTSRLLWGSDAPFVGHEGAVDYPSVLADFRLTVPDPADRLAISRTGLRLYLG